MDEAISLKQIMEEVRAEIAKNNLKADIPEFTVLPLGLVEQIAPFDMQAFLESVQLAQAYSRVEQYAPIGGNPVVRFIKRIVRKMTNFITTPLVESQNAFNAAVMQSVGQARDYIYALEKRRGNAHENTANTSFASARGCRRQRCHGHQPRAFENGL